MERDTALYKKVYDSFCRSPFLGLIGAELEEVGEGTVAIGCRFRNELTQEQGVLHGGLVTTLADDACCYAVMSMLPEGAEVVTSEFKINLMRPANTEKLVAHGRVVKLGRTLTVAEASVTDGSGEVEIARMLATVVVTKQNRAD